MEKLGKLTEISVRDIWPHEQYDFSKWLAAEENIHELSNALDLSITDIETEKFVGSYRCDIIGKDELSGKTVLIENQLEPTNHDHLGKIITYASGLDASVVVWIVETARSEHTSAIEWLNNHTTDDVAFFLIEVHAYRIGDSSPAPYFKIIEQPNDFTRSVKAIARGGDLSPTQEYRIDFWNKLNEAIDKKGKPFNKHKATPDHWYTVAVGTSQAYISIDLINKEHKVRVGLWIPDNKELFDSLYANKDAIEASCGYTLNWDRLENKKSSVICTTKKGLDFKKQNNYPELIDWIIETTVSLRDTMKEYL